MAQTQQAWSSSTTRREGLDVKGVRQQFDVHREDDEVIGPLSQTAATVANDPASMVNVDVVSEKIDIDVENGVARVTVRVRCERTVPIRGAADLFKKSAVIVTRLVEIDLTVTEERRRLYDRVLERTGGGAADRLGTEDTFALYKALMGLADSDQTAARERLHIERLLDEERASAAALVEDGPAAAAVLAAPAPRRVPRRQPAPPPPPRPPKYAPAKFHVRSAASGNVQGPTFEGAEARQPSGDDKGSETATTSFMY